ATAAAGRSSGCSVGTGNPSRGAAGAAGTATGCGDGGGTNEARTQTLAPRKSGGRRRVENLTPTEDGAPRFFPGLGQELLEEGPGLVRRPPGLVGIPAAVVGAENEVHPAIDARLRERVRHGGRLGPGNEPVLRPLDEEHRRVAGVHVGDRGGFLVELQL